MPSQENICGKCNGKYPSAVAYASHVCPVTGYTPRDPDHHGAEFKQVQEAALERGEEEEAQEEAQAASEAV